MIQMAPPPTVTKHAPTSSSSSSSTSSSSSSSTTPANANSPVTAKKRPAADNDDDEMFSPTSAAALALSTLHHYGARSDKDKRPPASALRGTRLFAASSAKKSAATSNANANVNAAPYYPPPPASAPAPAPAPGAAYHPPPPHHHHHHYHRNHHYAGDHYDRTAWPDRTSSESPAPWGAPPYQPRYPPPSSSSQETPATSYDYYHDDPHNESHYHRHPRASPPPGYPGGPSPPLTRSIPYPPEHHHHPKSSLARLVSATTLVTPTPKKIKTDHNNAEHSNAYSRKKKSLGILAENFLKSYENLPRGSTIVVDEAAIQLGVERRRIYDVVNILESICLVCKKHKNTYSWMGMDHLDAVFGRLQAQAIVEYPQDAEQNLGASQLFNNHAPWSPVPLKPPRRQSKNNRENKSLAKLSQEFLQVFLVGHETLSLPEASDKIQGTTSMEELIAMGTTTTTLDTTTTTTTTAMTKDPKEVKAAAARGLKTKIRRLYDIANVFLSVGLLTKVDSNDASRRPNFSWGYRLTAKALYELHRPTKEVGNNMPAMAAAPVAVTQSQEAAPKMSRSSSTLQETSDETESSLSSSTESSSPAAAAAAAANTKQPPKPQLVRPEVASGGLPLLAQCLGAAMKEQEVVLQQEQPPKLLPLEQNNNAHVVQQPSVQGQALGITI